MLYLNLVSNELKKEIKLRRLYFLIKKIGGVLLVITICLASILLTAKIILQNNFNKIVAQTTLITKNNQTYNVKVREINNKINFAAKIQKDYLVWTNLLKNLALKAPDGIKLYSLKLNADKKTFAIKGIAQNRDDLLKFKENIENLSVYDNIDFPLKNILEKENIDFEINADLNLNEIK
jgi:Tfp pilus assembly protein PilN